MDIGVTFVALSAIFVALFCVFSVPYGSWGIFVMPALAIPLAIFIVWGRKYRVLRLIGVILFGVFSYVWLNIDAFWGVLPCINSAIELINVCYNINIDPIYVNDPNILIPSLYPGEVEMLHDTTSFLWVLCAIQTLFGVLFLTVLKQGRRRFYGLFVFLLPVILGIFCGKVPEVKEGCFLLVAIFLFLIATYQRERVPVKQFLLAGILLFVIGAGAFRIETPIYEYKQTHTDEYIQVRRKLIEARDIDLSDWIYEEWKKININFGKPDEGKLPQIEMGIAWNKHLKTLEYVSHTGQVIDEVVLEYQPTDKVYWTMFQGYVYTGNGWEPKEKEAEGVYKYLERMERYCEDMQEYDNQRIANVLDFYFQRNFVYTKNPGKMPQGYDFAEGFMFAKKEGFCVHFATASTIVYQMCGKEARYVEGYMILPSEFKEQEDGTYKAIVKDTMAHAWCETLEANGTWKVREHTVASGLREEKPTPTPNGPTEAPSQTPTQTPSQAPSQTPSQTPTQQPTPTPSGIGDSMQEVPSENKANLKEFLLITWGILKQVILWTIGVGTTIITLIGVILLQRKLRVERRNKCFQHKNIKKSILAIYRAIQELCIFEGITDREVWSREQIYKIARLFPQLSKEEWEWMCDCVERTMFSNDVIQSEEQEKMYDLYENLRDEILQTLKGRRKVWFLYGRAL